MEASHWGGGGGGGGATIKTNLVYSVGLYFTIINAQYIKGRSLSVGIA
jgi:hypothetical protein